MWLSSKDNQYVYFRVGNRPLFQEWCQDELADVYVGNQPLFSQHLVVTEPITDDYGYIKECVLSLPVYATTSQPEWHWGPRVLDAIRVHYWEMAGWHPKDIDPTLYYLWTPDDRVYTFAYQCDVCGNLCELDRDSGHVLDDDAFDYLDELSGSICEGFFAKFGRYLDHETFASLDSMQRDLDTTFVDLMDAFIPAAEKAIAAYGRDLDADHEAQPSWHLVGPGWP